jgi:hypothetical protein
MSVLTTDRLPRPYRLQKPEVIFTSIDFPYSKAAISAVSEIPPSTSTVCISYVPLCTSAPEVIVNGGRQGGVWRLPGYTPLSWKARSKLCKLELMTAFIHLRETLSQVDPDNYEYVFSPFPNMIQLIHRFPSRDLTYYELKHPDDSNYQYVKTLLRGHLRSPAIQPHFEKCGELQTAGSSEDDLTNLPPFRGWIVSGERWESFTIDGQLRLDLSDSSFNSDNFPLPSPIMASQSTPAASVVDKATGNAETPDSPESLDNDPAQHVWSCRVG